MRTLILSGLLLMVLNTNVFSVTTGEMETSEPQIDIDTVVETLNETLNENRSLRQEVKELKETVKTADVEKNVLQSQIRRLARQEERQKSDTYEQMQERQRKIEKLKSMIKDLQIKSAQHQEMRMEAEERLYQIEGENERVRALLDQAILESERDQYVRLIETARLNSLETLDKVKSLESYNEQLRIELSSAHYNLGNIMFQSRDIDSALVHYERTLALDPTDSWAHHNLAIIYDYYKKNDEAATRHYREYLKLKPVNEEAHQVRERLLDRELAQHVIPPQPLRFEYNKSDHRTYEYPPSSRVASSL
jgi:tetratricopeptide (TPR) repeat protein